MEDHIVGLELQLVELVERRERAIVQGVGQEAADISDEIERLQAELMTTSEALVSTERDPEASVRADRARDGLLAS